MGMQLIDKINAEEAAKIAVKAQVPELWLTHYSPAMPKPDIYLDDLRRIFPGIIAAKDGRSVELRFEEDE